MLIPLPPLEALRADRARAAQPMPEEGVWLQVAVLVHRAAALPVDARAAHLEAAGALAEPETKGDPVEAVIGCAMRMQDATRLHLSLSTLDGISRLLPDAQAERRGRVVSFQGRVLRQLGDLDAARARYEAVEELGMSSGVDAVLARARIGYGVLAEQRGNYPEARRWYMEVLGMSSVASDSRHAAHHGMMVCACAAGDLYAGAQHAWDAYAESEGFVRPAALCDLSELLLRAGYSKAALSGFLTAVRQPMFPRHELPALGGLAIAAVRTLPGANSTRVLRVVKNRVEGLIADTQLPYVHTAVMVELAQAFTVVGDHVEAARQLERARALAATYQFHELTFRVETVTSEIRDIAERRPAVVDAPEHVVYAVESLTAVECLLDADLVLSSV